MKNTLAKCEERYILNTISIMLHAKRIYSHSNIKYFIGFSLAITIYPPAIQITLQNAFSVMKLTILNTTFIIVEM